MKQSVTSSPDSVSDTFPVPWAGFRLALLFGLIGSLSLSGCGGSLPATVIGTVTLDGKPLPSGELVFGTVAFYPMGAGAVAYGSIEDSKFILQTGDSAGLQIGEYRIGVRLVESEPAPPGGYQNAPGQKSLIPPHYEDPDRSGLSFLVADGQNVCTLELLSGAKP